MTIQPDVDGRWMTQFSSKTFVDATWLKAAISVQAIARGLIVRAQAKHKDTNRFSVTYGDYVFSGKRRKSVREKVDFVEEPWMAIFGSQSFVDPNGSMRRYGRRSTRVASLSGEAKRSAREKLTYNDSVVCSPASMA